PNCEASASTSACACAIDTPDFRRATTVLAPTRLCTCARVTHNGAKNSTSAPNRSKSAGITPMMVVGTRFSVRLAPTIARSPPKRDIPRNAGRPYLIGVGRVGNVPQNHEPIRSGKGRRLEQCRIDEAEDHGVRRDPERQRQRRDEGKPRLTAEVAQAVDDVGG